MKLRALVLAVVASAPLTGYSRDEPFLGSTVQLEVSPREANGAVDLHVAAPYPGRPYRILARGPGGGSFEVHAGTLGTDGQASALLEPRPGISLAGVNASFLAVVTPGDAGEEVASAWACVQLGAADPAEWAGFVRESSPALHEAGVALAAELADLDGDGDDDLVLIAAAGSSGSGVRFLASDGPQGFTPYAGQEQEATAPGARVLAFVDADGDGSTDVLIGTGESSGANALLRNGGAAGFTAVELPPKADPAGRTNAIVPADLDGDGAADLFVAGGIAGTHGVPAVPQAQELLRGAGDGTFAAGGELPAELAPVVTRAAAAGDVDLDGDIDLLAGNTAADHLLLNDGSARFADGSDRLPPAADSTYGVELADLDRDGDLDVLYANAMFSPAAATQLTNLGGAQGGEAGSFETAPFPALAAAQSPVRLVLKARDFDGDGDIDVCFGTHELGNNERPDLYLNQGGRQGGELGAFAPAAAFEALPGIYGALPAGDVDGDGDVDLLGFSTGTTVPGSLPESYVLRNQLFAAPDPPLAFARADPNQDLTSDLSDAVFILGYLFLGSVEPGCHAAADVDDNGVLELTDAIALLGHLFLGGAPPAAPYPGPGDDPTPSALGCGRVELFSAAAR